MADIDRHAISAGVIVCLTIVVPLQVLAVAFRGDGLSSGWAALTFLGTIAGFVLGAGHAAWVQTRRTPLTHGMIVTSGTYVIAQTLAIIVRLIRGSTVQWGAVVINLSLALVAGVIGGFLGSWLTRHGMRPKRG